MHIDPAFRQVAAQSDHSDRRIQVAIQHAAPGEIVDVRPLADQIASSVTRTLIKSEGLEVIRLVVPAGKEIAPHKVAGPITVQCLEGRIEFEVAGKRQAMSAGDLLYLTGGEMHSLRGLEDSSVLVTIQLVAKA
jgi:quercetin dioxygenase-like cupin family protein